MEKLTEQTERRSMVRSCAWIFSRWCKRDKRLETPLVNYTSLFREPEPVFYSRLGHKSESFHEIERMLIRLDEKLNALFSFLLRDKIATLMEGPFLGNIGGAGIKFGTKKAPPDVGEVINIEAYLDGNPPLLFQAEVEVLRVEKGDDGVNYIAGRFVRIAPRDQEQIVKFVFQQKREEIRATRCTG